MDNASKTNVSADGASAHSTSFSWSGESAPIPIPIEEFDELIGVGDAADLTLILAVSGSEGAVEKSAVIEIAALDKADSRIEIPQWRTRSNRFGEFAYVTPGTDEDPGLTRIYVQLPKGAVAVRVRGHLWHSTAQVKIVDQPLIHLQGDSTPDFRTSTGIEVSWGADAIFEEIAVPDHANLMKLRFSAPALVDRIAKSPVSIAFEGGDTSLVMPPSDLPQNPNFGPYLYLESRDEENAFEVSVPGGARTAVLRGVPWGDRTVQISRRPEVTFLGERATASVDQWLSGIGDSDPIIIIDSTAPPLGDDTRRLRPNNLAFEFASLGFKVLFIPFGTLQGMSAYVSSHLMQVDRRMAPQLIEAIAEMPDRMPKYYICTSFPSLENVARGEYLKMLGWKVVYEVRDDMEEFNRVGYSKWYHPLMERRMLSVAHKVVTVSAALTAKMKIMGPRGLSVETIPNGVNQATLDNSVDLRADSRLTASNESRTVGYVGHLTPSWFDWPAMLHAANVLPDVRFEVIGHGLPDDLDLPDNILFLGAMTHNEIIPIAQNWKVGVIPFIATPLTRGVDPNKIYEYFAWGLRVVSAPMGSVSTYPSTKVYRTVEEFAEQVRESVEANMDVDELTEIADFASNSSWRNRAAQMVELMEGPL